MSLITCPLSQGPYTVTIVVENLGRVNYGKPPLLERKGLGGLSVEGGTRDSIKIFSLDFTEGFISLIQEILENEDSTAMEIDLMPEVPSFTLGSLYISDDDARLDTHLVTNTWARGVVAVNGQVLGR